MVATTNITVILHSITVIDQCNAASVTVPANKSSVEINQFPDNDTSIVANREYNITVSAISDQGISYPSVPVVIGMYLFHIIMYVYNSVCAYTYIHTYMYMYT